MAPSPSNDRFPHPAVTEQDRKSARLYGFTPAIEVASLAARTRGAPIFIHSSWRTSHTWFWLKFRQDASTLCFCEPFHEHLAAVTRSEALVFGPASWDSGHPSSNPYFLEFLPLIRRTGGVRLFVPEISYRWFLPIGGLAGDLRSQEIKYLALLIRHAERCDKIPVFGFSRSVGRLVALKKRFPGIHIFQYRNLWTQWISILSQRRRGNNYFINVILDICLLAQDHFLSAIVNRYLLRAIERGVLDHVDRCPEAGNLRDRLTTALAVGLSEQDLFSLYMAFHTYVYTVAQLSADLVIDVTKVARDLDYRESACRQLTSATGISITLADASDMQQYHPFDATAIHWQEIEDNLDFAVRTLDHMFDRQELLRVGRQLIDETLTEMRLSEKYIAAARREVSKLTSERDTIAAARCRLVGERDQLAGERDAAIAERDRIAEQREVAIANTERLSLERDAANLERERLIIENARLADQLAAATTAHSERVSESETLRTELSHLAADRDRVAAECAQWFDAAIIAAADSVVDSLRSRRSGRLHRLARRLGAATLRSRSGGVVCKRSPSSRANLARDARQWARAARFYLDVLNQDPYAVAIWVELGNALKEAGKFPEAELAYGQAVALDAGSLDTLLPLADVLKLREKCAEAAVIYARAFDLAPTPALRHTILNELATLGSPTGDRAFALATRLSFPGAGLLPERTSSDAGGAGTYIRVGF